MLTGHFFFFINFQIQTALSQLWLQICGYVISLSSILPNLLAIFWSQSFQHTPLKILVNSESGVHVFSGVLCRNAWNSALHLFIIWFTDTLANLDIQTELQDCLYEYGFKDKWYRLELLASVVLHSDYKGLWWSNVAVKRPLSRPPTYFDARERDYIVFQTGFDGWAIFLRLVSFFPGFIYSPPPKKIF